MSKVFEAAGSQSGEIEQLEEGALTLTEWVLIQRYRRLDAGMQLYFHQAIEAVEAMQKHQSDE